MGRFSLSALEDDHPVAAAISERSRDQNGVLHGQRAIGNRHLLVNRSIPPIEPAMQQIGNLLLELAFLDDSPIHPPNGVYLHRLSGHENHPVCLDALVLTLARIPLC